MIDRVNYLLKKVDFFKKQYGPPRILKIWKKTNLVILVEFNGEKYILKDSLRGYGLYELMYMKLLRMEGYPVPEPVDFYPIELVTDEDWAYGNISRYRGILVYKYVEGICLCEDMSEKNVSLALDLMKRLHQDPRHRRNKSFIPDYERAEVNRLMFYVKRLGINGEIKLLLEYLSELYLGEKIDYILIHGDYRPQNLLLTNSKICMIDLEGVSDGADKYKDAGTFAAESLRIGFNSIEIFLKKHGYEIDSIRYIFYLIRRFLVILKYDKRPNVRKKIMNLMSRVLYERVKR